MYLVQGDPALIDRWLADLSLVDAEQTPVQPAAQPIEVWLREPLHGDKNAITVMLPRWPVRATAPLGCLDPLAVHGDWPNVTGQATHRLLILPCLGHNGPLRGRSQGHRLHGVRMSAVLATAPAAADRARRPGRRCGVDLGGVACASGSGDDSADGGAVRAAVRPFPRTMISQAFVGHIVSAGSTMQRTAQRLTAHQVDAVFHLRQGAPELVIWGGAGVAILEIWLLPVLPWPIPDPRGETQATAAQAAARFEMPAAADGGPNVG